MERETVTMDERKVTLECDGRIQTLYQNSGLWTFFAVGGKDSFLIARKGYFEINGATTTDTADFIAVKEAIIWAATEYSNRKIEVHTKSAVVVNWLQDESSTQHLEIYRELYERKAFTGEYTIRQIPEEDNRAANPARRRNLVIAKKEGMQ
jgi:ribonuclease HI